MLGTVGAASLAPVLPGPAAARLAEDAAAPPPQAVPAFRIELTTETASPLEAEGVARITGGVAHGRALAGAVEGGCIQWRPHPAGVEVTAQVAVRRPDGHLVELVERGILSAAQRGSRTALCTTTELFASDGDFPAFPALLVGRLDLGRLGEGAVSLLTYEVS
jgi:hypothetical protein